MELVVNNDDLSKIRRMGFTKAGLNEDENALILSNIPQDEFLRVTAQYQFCMDQVLDIEDDLCPSLKAYMEGPFVLSIFNQGSSLSKSMLVFGVNPIEQEENTGEIISTDTHNLTARALTIIPFVDVFREQIEAEAEHAAKLISASKVSSLDSARAQDEMNSVKVISESFLRQLNMKNEQSTDRKASKPIGKEAVSDHLAGSLDAQAIFYDFLWGQMTEFFDDTFRHLGEQHALGRENLEAPEPIIPE